MERVAGLLVVVAAVAGAAACAVPTSGRIEVVGAEQSAPGAASPRSAREVRGPTPYLPAGNEPPPKLIVDDPLPEGLPLGLVFIQYRTENCRILPVFGKEALDVSPRIGHLHVRVDDLHWGWADASDLNTIDIAGLPPGEHKVTIDIVDPAHQVYPGQSKTVKFTMPKGAAPPH